MMMKLTAAHAMVAGLALFVGGCGDSGTTDDMGTVDMSVKDSNAGASMATATINETGGAQGTATFTDSPNGVMVSIMLTKVPTDGMHGMHIHATGDCSDTTGDGGAHHGAAGGHFNPTMMNHGCPPATPHHAGDLGNVMISGGSGTLTITTKDITVAAGANSIVGKAIILHAGADDCVTQPTGNSGGRIGCAVITAK
jgi:Cu-Zn family superoxide dismutase